MIFQELLRYYREVPSKDSKIIVLLLRVFKYYPVSFVGFSSTSGFLICGIFWKKRGDANSSPTKGLGKGSVRNFKLIREDIKKYANLALGGFLLATYDHKYVYNLVGRDFFSATRLFYFLATETLNVMLEGVSFVPRIATSNIVKKNI